MLTPNSRDDFGVWEIDEFEIPKTGPHSTHSGPNSLQLHLSRDPPYLALQCREMVKIPISVMAVGKLNHSNLHLCPYVQPSIASQAQITYYAYRVPLFFPTRPRIVSIRPSVKVHIAPVVRSRVSATKNHFCLHQHGRVMLAQLASE